MSRRTTSGGGSWARSARAASRSAATPDDREVALALQNGSGPVAEDRVVVDDYDADLDRALTGQMAAQQPSYCLGLLDPEVGHLRVELALDAALEVPARLAGRTR